VTARPTIGERLGALTSAVVVTALAGLWLAGTGNQGLGAGDFYDTVAEQQAG